ncbi:unnamed protein product [Dicrocoelium dendriticum]|nr:unnamed protein product [Dicrocoelium dendriticum]
MNLGSPTTSPNNSLSHGTGTQYLPGFLLGENIQSQTATRIGPSMNSRPMQLSPTPIPSLSTGESKQSQHHLNGGIKHSDRVGKRLASPPTQGLWSTVQQTVPSRPNNPLSGVWDTNSIRHSTPTGAAMIDTAHGAVGGQFRSPSLPVTPGMRGSNPQPRSMCFVQSPLATNDRAGILTPDRLISVLNSQPSYPTCRASFILGQFAQFGTIEKHVITNDGNWMHIKYQNKLQARNAVGRNGRIFGDNIMVGVMPCTNQDVMCNRVVGAQAGEFDVDRENSFLDVNSPARPRLRTGTPLGDHSLLKSNGASRNISLMNQSFASPSQHNRQTGGVGVARHSSMRALAGDNRSGYLNRTASVRQNKESGLLSKALGYMFGWS